MQFNSHNESMGDSEEFGLDIIAANVVKWNRHQERAFGRSPLAYVDALLGQMAEAGGVDIGRIGEALMELLPDLTERESDELVALYMRGR